MRLLMPSGLERAMTMDQQRHYGEGTVFQRTSDGLWIARLKIGFGQGGRRRRWQAASRKRHGAMLEPREARLHRAAGRAPDDVA